MKLWITKEEVPHKLSTGVSALLQTQILRAAAAWGGQQDAEGMAKETKGCYWFSIHTRILWCPCTHSSKVIRQNAVMTWALLTVLTALKQESRTTFSFYTVQKAFIDFTMMHLENIVLLEGCLCLCLFELLTCIINIPASALNYCTNSQALYGRYCISDNRKR